MQAEGKCDPVTEKYLRHPVDQLFAAHLLVVTFGQILGQDPIDGQAFEDTCQVWLVYVVKIVVDDVFNGNGESLENVKVLGK